jgi:hypothetical protein
MSEVIEVVLEDEIALMLDAYDGNPDVLINDLLAEHFLTKSVNLKTANGRYKTNPALEFPPECNHPEHDMFNYCPYTPEERRALGDKPL